MEYQDLIHEYELTHTPGNHTQYNCLRDLVIENNFKVLVVRRETWAKSYAIIDTAWFPSPAELTRCKIWANVLFHGFGPDRGHSARLEMDNPYKKGFYDLLFVSDIDMILNYSKR